MDSWYLQQVYQIMRHISPWFCKSLTDNLKESITEGINRDINNAQGGVYVIDLKGLTVNGWKNKLKDIGYTEMMSQGYWVLRPEEVPFEVRINDKYSSILSLLWELVTEDVYPQIGIPEWEGCLSDWIESNKTTIIKKYEKLRKRRQRADRTFRKFKKRRLKL